MIDSPGYSDDTGPASGWKFTRSRDLGGRCALFGFGHLREDEAFENGADTSSNTITTAVRRLHHTHEAESSSRNDVQYE